MTAAKYVSNSKNSKLGNKPVDTTYASINATCPNSCELKNNGCYASLSFVAIQVAKLDKSSIGVSAVEAARHEARAIDESYGGGKVPSLRDMRLHVSGDSRTIKGSKLINSSVGRWKKRGGGDCWSYSHAWRNVPRSVWSHVSMLASISKPEEAVEARKQGYAPAIVVSEFSSPKAFTVPGSDVKYIPCPAQTSPGGKDIGCTECRLCFNADRLYEKNIGIAFEAHGVKKNDIKRRLKMIQI
jgi:hypothetical protein